MNNKFNKKLEIISFNDFNFIYFKTKPLRLEAKIIFNRDDLSQKLIFTLMDITHEHGFGCSAPVFKGIDDASMTFVIGSILPSAKHKDKYIEKLNDCLIDILEFSKQFVIQLDFSKLDLTMFSGVDLESFCPLELAAIRDQIYEGSWDKFSKDLEKEERSDELEIIKKCKEFEIINNKDVGLIGHKLNDLFDILGQNPYSKKNGILFS